MARIGVDDLLRQARAGLSRLEAPAAYAALGRHDAVLVDVRVSENLARDGHVPGALEISLNVLEWRLDPDSGSRHPRAPDLGATVIVLCEQGFSSSFAAQRLQALGFARATDVIGGFEAWAAAGLPVAPEAGDPFG